MIPLESQHLGCESHVLHPDLVPWKQLNGPSDWVAVYEIDGKPVLNGKPSEGVYGSKELLANPVACAEGDALLMGMRKEWDGRVVG